MAPGYVIAACLEGAGALGVVVGLWVLHREQRARAAELARFLRSGQVPETEAPKVRPSAVRRAPPAVRPRAPAAAGPSDALRALRSAYGAPGL